MSYQSDLAKDVLGLKWPFTENILKQRFRELAKNTHPDLGGDAEDFKRLKEAVDFLLPFVENTSTSSDLIFTHQGNRIASLGKGYPLNVNAVTCLSCDGKGYVRRPRVVSEEGVSCIICLRGWVYTKNGLRLRCKHCEGGWVFNFATKGVDIHTCSDCEGKGEIRTVNAVLSRGSLR